MKKQGNCGLLIFTFSLIAILSFLYQTTSKEQYLNVSQMLPSTSPTLALTFDLNTPSDTIMPLLETLNKHNVKATFFITGSWFSAHHDTLLQMLEQGHEIGNHTKDHIDLTTLPGSSITEQISSLHNQVFDLAGVTMKLFRPPYGSYDQKIIDAAKKQDYTIVNWNIDSNDWKGYDTQTIIHTICNHPNLTKGSILLFQTQDAFLLDELIPALQEQGYGFDTVSAFGNRVSS